MSAGDQDYRTGMAVGRIEQLTAGDTIASASTGIGYQCQRCGMQGFGVHWAGCPELMQPAGPTLTASEVREIVRDEIQRALKDAGLPPYMVKP